MLVCDERARANFGVNAMLFRGADIPLRGLLDKGDEVVLHRSFALKSLNHHFKLRKAIFDLAKLKSSEPTWPGVML